MRVSVVFLRVGSLAMFQHSFSKVLIIWKKTKANRYSTFDLDFYWVMSDLVCIWSLLILKLISEGKNYGLYNHKHIAPCTAYNHRYHNHYQCCDASWYRYHHCHHHRHRHRHHTTYCTTHCYNNYIVTWPKMTMRSCHQQKCRRHHHLNHYVTMASTTVVK